MFRPRCHFASPVHPRFIHPGWEVGAQGPISASETCRSCNQSIYTMCTMYIMYIRFIQILEFIYIYTLSFQNPRKSRILEISQVSGPKSGFWVQGGWMEISTPQRIGSSCKPLKYWLIGDGFHIFPHDFHSAASPRHLPFSSSSWTRSCVSGA